MEIKDIKELIAFDQKTMQDSTCWVLQKLLKMQ